MIRVSMALSILLGSISAICAKPVESDAPAAENDYWLNNLLGNIMAYAVVVVPAGVLIKYLRSSPEKMSGPGMMLSCIRLCVVGQPESSDATSPLGTDSKPELGTPKSTGKEDEPFILQAMKLGFCAIGLQASYLTWGALQEQIMTQSYGEGDDKEQFKSSQFLVFVNRILAFVAALAITQFTQQPKHTVPVHKYSFPSLSNVMSSWFQYEALKFVSFPTQVVAKASKVIPVMLMGKLVNGQTYPAWEYGINVLLSMGVALFSFSQTADPSASEEEEGNSAVGIFLLLGYLFFDSFTSNYQSALFKEHKMSKYQMMFGVNLFSCFFTMWSLIGNGNLAPALGFFFRHPQFMYHTVILSITSATGQLFIFHTIATYGPLVFTIIMTTRQVLSIFLSSFLFGHTFSSQGWVGIGTVAMCLFGRIYLKRQEQLKK
jgi:adenosine 3'-phospho 5'-phosphosulfate transporter B2